MEIREIYEFDENGIFVGFHFCSFGPGFMLYDASAEGR